MQSTREMAIAAIEMHQSGSPITADQVKDMLRNVNGTTFASMVTVTKVTTAAAHKSQSIFKVTNARIQLFNNISEFTNVYANAVKRSADGNVEHFQTQENYFEHTECFSLVQHKEDPSKKYLYVIYNGAESTYIHNDEVLTTEDVAAYCTPSEAKKLLSPTPSHNVLNNVTHNVIVRVLKLDSIVQLKAMKQVLTKD